MILSNLQGECCAAGSRTFVHESIYDEFVQKAKQRALTRSVGDPFKEGIEQGPQVVNNNSSCELVNFTVTFVYA